MIDSRLDDITPIAVTPRQMRHAVGVLAGPLIARLGHDHPETRAAVADLAEAIGLKPTPPPARPGRAEKRRQRTYGA